MEADHPTRLGQRANATQTQAGTARETRHGEENRNRREGPSSGRGQRANSTQASTQPPRFQFNNTGSGNMINSGIGKIEEMGGSVHNL